jgi:hypothetical protein
MPSKLAMGYLPGEQELLNYIADLETEGISNLRERTTKFSLAVRFVRGHQWETRPPKYRTDATYNFIHQTIDRKVALLTDSKPNIQVRALSGGNDGTATALSKICEAIWQSESMDLFLMEIIHYAALAGFAFADTWIDREYSEPRISAVDPRYLIYDPLVLRPQFLSKGEYVVTWGVMPLSEARDRYPKRADDIMPDYTGEGIDTSGGGVTGRGAIISRLRTLLQSGPSEGRPQLLLPRCWVRQVWLKDRRRDKSGEPIYPGGRFIKIVGGVIVEDSPNPYIDRQFPHDMLNWYFDVDGPWGNSEYDLLRSPQETMNKMISSVVDNVLAINNQVWIGDFNALTEKEWAALANVPGAKIKKRPGSEIRRDAPPALPPHIYSFLQLGIHSFEALSGITEVMQGRRAGQVVSGAGIEALQQAAQTTIRLKSRQIEAFLSRIGQKLIARIFQAYTADRVFHTVGADGKAEAYNFKRAEILKGHENPARALRCYEFVVEPGSSLKMARWQKTLLASQLFQLGVIDEEELLDVVQWPNRKEIASRVAAKRAAMAAPMGPRAANLPHPARISPQGGQMRVGGESMMEAGMT